MKKFFSIAVMVALMFIVLPFVLSDMTADAETYGDLTYYVADGEAYISGCSESAIGDIVIPSKLGGYPVTWIGSYAFYDCKYITSVTIPDSVISIDNYAFENCPNLKSVTIPNSVTSIGDYAFADCYSLTSITIPNSVTSIGDMAFYCCTSLKDVYITDIAAWCNIYFADTTSNPLCYAENLYLNNKLVTDLTIPSSVTSLVYYSFYDCDSLKSVTIPKSVTSIGGSAFYGCSGLTSVTIPNSVTSIDSCAFRECSSLTSITIPSSVTSIDGYAFFGCSSLTSITIPSGIKSIYDYTFSGCSSLTSVTIPKSVTSIGGSAFLGCSSLTSITIPSGVKSIYNNTFYGCSGLTSITIPNSVTIIGDGAFDGCSSLTSITVDSKNSYYKSKGNCLIEKSTKTLIQGCKNSVIPDDGSVTSIGDSAFRGCSGLTSITIPNSVTSIGYYAFYDCSGLTSVTLGKNVKSIGYNAFDNIWNIPVVYYRGSESDKAGISMNNSRLEGSTWYCNSCIGKANHTTCTDTVCKVCGDKKKATSHTYKTTTTAATLSKNGKQVKKCTVCETVASTTTIKYVKSITLSTSSYTYNGSVKTPSVIVKDSAGKVLKKDTDYTVSYASGIKNVGTYNVEVKMKGKYSGTKTLTFKINPINVSECDMALCNTVYTYDGTSKIPCVTVLSPSGTKLTDSSYTVKYSSGRKKVGTYNVTVTMKGNYTGTKTLTYRINKTDVNDCVITLSKTSFSYDGKTHKPTVTVKTASGEKLLTSSYEVSYSSGCKKVGTYSVTIKGVGNFTGTKKLTFKINPPATTVSKLTAGSKSITVGITKKSTQVTGYEVQYSTSSKFTNATTKTISSYNTTSYTLKSLSAKKTYYVRVRTYKTVNGTKYYSGWSTYKYVKTK